MKDYSSFLVYLSIVLICFLPDYVASQAVFNTGINKVTISSPTAASLGKYGDIPVNFHTGIPQISIPVYTIQSGPLKLPVSFSYHGSGLKVQEHASWVGAGWSLNAGGVITRTVMGGPDDKGLYAANTQKGHFSDYGYNSYIFSPGPAICAAAPAMCPVGRTGMAASNYPPQDSYIQTGIFDGEPDWYFFNFNGYSGKFYFSDDRTPVIVPQQDLNINPIYPGNDWRGMTGFVVTTPDGTQYFFGKNQNGDGGIDAIEITYNTSTQSAFTGQGAVSSWYLNKIESADGEFKITLTYEAENYSNYNLAMFPIPGVRNPNFFAYNFEYDLNKNFIKGIRLSSIHFETGDIIFKPGNLRQDLGFGTGSTTIADVQNTDANEGAKSLASIEITSSDFCKKLSLYTSYFYDNTPLKGLLFTTVYPSLNIESDKYRLRLDSIQESTCDNTIKQPPYKFTYWEGTVPRKLSFAIDHWGFFNNAVSNTGLIPTYSITQQTSFPGNVTNIPGADRDSHWPASLGGTIKQIKYPTGGTTSFEFESNSVFSTQTSSGLGALAVLPTHMYGQSTTTATASIVSSGNTLTVKLKNFSNYPGNFSIRNSNNVVVHSFNIPESSNPPSLANSFEYPVNLLAGSYQLTISLPAYSNLNGGAIAEVLQWSTTQQDIEVQVGGPRIKTVASSSGNETGSIITSYQYKFDNLPNGRSSGILFSRPVYVQPLRNDAWGTVSGASCSPIGCFNCFGSDVAYYQSPASIRPMSTSHGNHIGYAEVYVSQTGNGYSAYKYYGSNGTLLNSWDPPIKDVCVRSLSTLCEPNITNSPIAPEPFDPMRGELAYQADYNQAGQVLRSKAYFPTFSQESIVTPGIISKFFVTAYSLQYGQAMSKSMVDPELANIPSNTAVPVGVGTITEYTLRSVRKISDSIVTNEYNPQTGAYLTQINTTYYQSPYHFAPTTIMYVSSKNEQVKTSVKYASDFRINNFTISDYIGTYNSNLISNKSYLSNALAGITLSASDPNYYWARLNIYMNYRYMNAVDRQIYIAYRLANLSGTTSNYQIAHNTAKANASSELRPILDLQDKYINAPIETTYWRNNILTSATFAAYNYPSTASTNLYLTKLQKLFPPSLSSNFVPAILNGNSLIKDSRYSDEATFTYDRGNLVELVKRDGIKSVYIYGYKNQYPVGELTGASYNTIKSLLSSAIISTPASDEAMRTELNKIRLNLPNVYATTFTYKALVGLTSQTDLNGRTTYYEYDNLGRLSLIRDHNNNILKKFCYNYQGQVEACASQ